MPAKKKMPPEDMDDIVMDEDGEDLSVSKIKKLKAELAACKKERQEYLDGWQRLRADVANSKRESESAHARAVSQARESILADLAPVLDSFAMAFQGSAWEQVDESWRKGIEYIHTQFEQVLTTHGITTFGAPGEAFDPALHEATGTAEGGPPDTVAAVSQAGYKIGTKVIRPARVTVYK